MTLLYKNLCHEVNLSPNKYFLSTKSVPDIAYVRGWDMTANKTLSVTSGKPKVWLRIQRINNDKNNVICNLIEETR